MADSLVGRTPKRVSSGSRKLVYPQDGKIRRNRFEGDTEKPNRLPRSAFLHECAVGSSRNSLRVEFPRSKSTLGVAKLLEVATSLRADDGNVGRELGARAERVSVKPRGFGATGKDSKFVSKLEGRIDDGDE